MVEIVEARRVEIVTVLVNVPYIPVRDETFRVEFTIRVLVEIVEERSVEIIVLPTLRVFNEIVEPVNVENNPSVV